MFISKCLPSGPSTHSIPTRVVYSVPNVRFISLFRSMDLKKMNVSHGQSQGSVNFFYKRPDQYFQLLSHMVFVATTLNSACTKAVTYSSKQLGMTVFQLTSLQEQVAG